MQFIFVDLVFLTDFLRENPLYSLADECVPVKTCIPLYGHQTRAKQVSRMRGNDAAILLKR